MSKVHTFRQSDLTRALNAIQKQGLNVKSLEIDPLTGRIKIVVAGGELDADSSNEWDKVLRT